MPLWNLGLYPHRVGLNRGNHETKDMNKVYGFEGEVRHKHGEQTYKVDRHIYCALYNGLNRYSQLFSDVFTSRASVSPSTCCL